MSADYRVCDTRAVHDPTLSRHDAREVRNGIRVHPSAFPAPSRPQGAVAESAPPRRRENPADPRTNFRIKLRFLASPVVPPLQLADYRIR